MEANLSYNPAELERICERWGVAELALFGSVLRDDFGPHSDVDVLVRFAPGRRVSAFDLVDLHDALEGIFGRSVDMVEAEALRNPFRRRAILSNLHRVHAA